MRNDSSWDVTRHRVETVDVTKWALLLPFQITVAADDKQATGGTGKTMGLGGNMVIRGANTPFAFPIKKKPINFRLDQRGQVLAYFYCESREPKRMLMYRALEADGDEAEKMMRQALRTPLYSEQSRAESGLSEKDLAKQERLMDARIQMQLARIALQEGDYEAAFKQSRSLWLWFPYDETDAAASEFRRNRWGDGRIGDGEDYALLAVAAYETGQRAVAVRAMEEAEKRRADMAPLRELLGE